MGLWRPKESRWGALRLTTIGRRSSRQRSVILGYFQDGPNLVTMVMNGWGDGEPAWWLNLQAHPDAKVRLADGPQLVTARAAADDERSRLWARWREIDENLDAYAALRSSETAVVVLSHAPRGSRAQASRKSRYAPPHRYHRNLGERIQEARLNGWLGEVDGLQASLNGASANLSALTGCANASRPAPPARRPRHQRPRRHHHGTVRLVKFPWRGARSGLKW